jgi:hypothetical protein
MKQNPSYEAPPLGFKRSLEKWIHSASAKDVAKELILLDNHYKYDKVDNMLGPLDFINKESSTSFL